MPLSVLDASVEVGKAVAKLAAKQWMDVRREQRERSSELIDLVSISVRDKIKARRLSRQLEDIADEVAERFQSFYDAELPVAVPSR